MQKVLGRVRRLSIPASARKPQEATIVQPPLPPLVLGPPKLDNWLEPLLLQYGHPDESESRSDIIPGHRVSFLAMPDLTLNMGDKWLDAVASPRGPGRSLSRSLSMRSGAL